MHDRTLAVAAEQLRQLDPLIRILIAHPQLKSHHSLIRHILERFDGIYYKAEAHLENADALELQINATYNLYGIAKARRNDTALVLDHGDLLPEHVVREFFVRHLKKKQGGLLLYCARQYPQFIEQYPQIEVATKLWPVSKEWMLIDYLQRDRNRRLVEVYALGSGRALVDGKSIVDWEGSLPRHLFFYMTDRGLRTRSQIFDTIWADLASREATNVFHVTKRKVNEILGFDLTIYRDGFYRLSSDIDLIYDVSRFIENFQASAVAQSDTGLSLLEQCLAAYKGDFLNGTETTWVQERREELRLMHSEVLAAAAHLNDKARHPELAIGRFARAHVFNPKQQEYPRSLIRIYTALGRKNDTSHVRQMLQANSDSKDT